MSPQLVIIRPSPGAEATAALARAAGFDPLVLPLFDVAPLPWTAGPPDAYDAIVVASANVLRHGGAALATYRTLPLFAVGEKTAELARKAGFTVAATGSGGIEKLWPLVADAGHVRILRPSGRDHMPADHPALSVDTVPVYEARALDLAPADAARIAPDAIIALHSARAAAHWRDQAARLALPASRLAIAAFAPAIAAAAGGGWRAVAVADTPCDAALLSAAQTVVTSA